MPQTVTIPLTTLPPGVFHFGPADLADADVLAVITIDRTVANGFNAQPVTTTANILVEQSSDGGATWFPLASDGFAGGILVNPRTGLTVNANDVGVELQAGTGRKARATVTISGASVAVQGTLVIT